MRNAAKIKYSIPRPCIEAYLGVCKSCNEKKSISRKLVVKPITSKDFNERGQVDLIDFQSLPDGKYKWILNYQDHSTKFVSLRPLQTKRAAEVASQLLKIFLTFGAPRILQSDNGREFVNHVITEMKQLWPECIIVNGRPRHPQSQGSIERSNQDIENMIRAWMSDHNCTHWATGLHFVQWYKNVSHHRIIGRSPYKALFGHIPRVGFTSSNLPKEVLERLVNEEDLEDLPGEISENEKTLTENDLTGVISEPERQLLTTENNGQSGDGGSEDGEFSEVAAMESNMNENEELTIREEYIRKEREAAYEGQKRAAEKMLSPKHRKITFTVNDCVLVSVPKVDRGPTDPQNIVGIIIDCKNDVYQVATEYGVIKGWYGHDSLQHATSSFLKIEDLRTSKHLSLREAVAASSGGQGVAKCACKPSKQQCKTKRCLCKKSNRLCTSRCHSSLNCINK